MDNGDLRRTYAELLANYDWDWLLTLTSHRPLTSEHGDRKSRILLKKLDREVYRLVTGRSGKNKLGQFVWWVRAEERKALGRLHYHLLIGGVQAIDQRSIIEDCFTRFGNVHIQPFDPNRSEAAFAYILKDLTADNPNIEYDLTAADNPVCLTPERHSFHAYDLLAASELPEWRVRAEIRRIDSGETEIDPPDLIGITAPELRELAIRRLTCFRSREL